MDYSPGIKKGKATALKATVHKSSSKGSSKLTEQPVNMVVIDKNQIDSKVVKQVSISSVKESHLGKRLRPTDDNSERADANAIKKSKSK